MPLSRCDWHSLWAAPHRPLFALAGLWAFAAPAVWLLPESFVLDRTAWHAHELLFGMGGAAVGGCLLTALPAWTGGEPVQPVVTRMLTMLWLAARVAGLFGDHIPAAVRLAGTAGYFAGLAAVLAWHLLPARVWSRLWVLLAPVILGGAAILSGSDNGEMRRNAPLLFSILIILIGGRAVPAFTRYWLKRMDVPVRLDDRPFLSRAAIPAILGAVLLDGLARGLLLIIAAALLFLRMARWQGLETVRYPALFMMHAAWASTPFGLLLVGFASIFPGEFPVSSALHALTMGAMGTMMLSFMLRPAMIRENDRLLVSRTMAGAYMLVCMSAFLRIGGGWLAVLQPLSALCWMAGWGLFILAYRPALSGPVQRPIFSVALRR
ncbi:NnrS family protein [Brucella endophytica]|uniref:NnrS family protein n=1 Tax=Brucella endophytica TaxID=1963359 RepID=UPI001F3A1127|nr:NnrS family protein [Brucella endophytica]